MFKNYYKLIVENPEKVDYLIRIASNHGLYGLYKIGVYGAQRQHEVYITGSPWRYRRFLKEIFPKKK